MFTFSSEKQRSFTDRFIKDLNFQESMEIRLTTRYDEEADAAYIYLDDKAEVVKTVELNKEVLSDARNGL